MTVCKTKNDAVLTLQDIAAWLNEYADEIIGEVKGPPYIFEDGINVSFSIEHDAIPTVTVSKKYAAMGTSAHDYE